MQESWVLRGLAVLMSLVPVAAVAEAVAPVPAAGAVRVGFICPFSGGSQDFSNSARLGAELAVKEINEVGGYLGRRIELVERDDKANPDEGRKVSEDLVLKQKVAFTIGFCNSGVALKSLDVFQDHKHLLGPCRGPFRRTAAWPVAFVAADRGPTRPGRRSTVRSWSRPSFRICRTNAAPRSSRAWRARPAVSG